MTSNNNLKPIPILGILTMKRYDLLIRLIKKIDYPIDNVVIIFQEGFKDFNFNNLLNDYIKKITLITVNFNIGVSRGWNYIIENFESDYWLISGDDNYFLEGSLKNISNFMENNKSQNYVFCGFGMTNNTNKIYDSAGFSSFILTKNILNKIGLFDENIYPAYFEDNDLWERIVVSKESVITIPSAIIYSGDEKNTSSCTLHSVDSNYRNKMNECYRRNEIYFKNKLLNYNINNLKDKTKHENYYNNQNILVGHSDSPIFSQRIIIMSDLKKFNWQFYINSYKDLTDNNINTQEKALYHWIEFGINEKRISFP